MKRCSFPRSVFSHRKFLHNSIFPSLTRAKIRNWLDGSNLFYTYPALLYPPRILWLLRQTCYRFSTLPVLLLSCYASHTRTRRKRLTSRVQFLILDIWHTRTCLTQICWHPPPFLSPFEPPDLSSSPAFPFLDLLLGAILFISLVVIGMFVWGKSKNKPLVWNVTNSGEPASINSECWWRMYKYSRSPNCGKMLHLICWIDRLTCGFPLLVLP